MMIGSWKGLETMSTLTVKIASEQFGSEVTRARYDPAPQEVAQDSSETRQDTRRGQDNCPGTT